MSERSFEAPLEDDNDSVEATFSGTQFLGEHDERESSDAFSGEFGERMEDTRHNESREAVPTDVPID